MRLQVKHFLLLIIISVTTMLAGCGFHLRGVNKLPSQLQTIYFQSTSPYSEFSRQLKTTLNFSNVKLVSSPEQAPLTLSVTNENFSTYQTTVGSSDQTREYKATYTVLYNIQNNSGKIIIGSLSVSNFTTIIVNPNEVLENSNKLNIAKQSLIRNLVMKMMFQLTSKNTITTLNKINAIHYKKVVSHENIR